MTTSLTRTLGIQYPIIQGGMQWVGIAELAAAVSNAGGLGMLSALTQPDPPALAREIERCRALTGRPFGVNITMLPSQRKPDYEAIIETVIDARVPLVETAGNVPEALLARLKSAGLVIIHKCTSLKHALAAQRRGVDIVAVDGFECAGHPGEDDVSAMVLLPTVAPRLSIPVIAAGGITNGAQMAAAISLGASGVTMGTRLACTQESPIHPNIKQALVDATERDTCLILRTFKNSSRVLRNQVANHVLDLEHRTGGTGFEEIYPWVAGERGRQTLMEGNVDGGPIWIGMAVGLIHDLPSCSELLPRLMHDCRAALDRAHDTLSQTFPNQR